jgi:murein DD-endopeptidase MepM/ murein hydrolase activator NlpD
MNSRSLKKPNLYSKSAKQLLVLSLFLVILGTVLEAQENVNQARQKLSNIKQTLEKNKRKLAQKRAQKQKAERDLWGIRRNLKRTEIELNSARQKLELAKKRLLKSQQELSQKQVEFDEKRRLLEVRVREIYKTQNMGFVEFLLAPNDVMSKLDSRYYFERLLEADINLIKEVNVEYKQLVKKRSMYQQHSRNILALNKTIKRKEAQLKSQRSSQARVVSTLSTEIDKIIRENKELEENSNSLAEFLIRNARGNVYYGTGSFTRPLKRTRWGWISSTYGWRTHPIAKRRIKHNGVDFAAPKGYRIMAADTGKVLVAGYRTQYKGYGKITVIDHGYDQKIGKRVTSVYAHQSRILVREGGIVKKGQEIGWVGSTGYSTGPHLHFEIRHNGQPVNPMRYIR